MLGHRARTNVLLVLAVLTILCTTARCADVRMSGYGLFKVRTPAWSWDAIPVSTPIATMAGDGDSWRVSLTVPLASIGSPEPERVRVGVVCGFVGAEPVVSVTADKPFDASPGAAAPTDSLVAGAVLQSAHLSLADGRFTMDMVFDGEPQLRSGWDLYLLVDTDGDSRNGFRGADYLIQNTALGAEIVKGGLDIPWLEIRPGILKPGQSAEVVAWVANNTSSAMPSVTVDLGLPTDVRLTKGERQLRVDLKPNDARRLIWRISPSKSGVFRVKLSAQLDRDRSTALRSITAVDKRDPKHEFETVTGAWIPYPSRPTLQAGNTSPIREFRSLPSAKLKRNLFGITAHLPRSTNEEDPFIAANAVDGNTYTCWASRWWRTEIPLDPDWLQVDLGKAIPVSEFRFLPVLRNSGLPRALTIQTSADGHAWDTSVDECDYKPQTAPDGSPLRVGDLSWQCFPLAHRSARYIRVSANRMGQGSIFFCCPSDQYQFRIAEVQVLDGSGTPIHLGAKDVSSSTVHTAWYNSPETIAKTWPMMLNSGVKLNRIGQWGDKIGWASVEKVKGVYRIDPEADRAITESVDSGIDILLTLEYGNDLYQKLSDPQDIGPTWEKGHPFHQSAPTTDEAIRGFANYCAFMAKHFRGRVKYYEIWNEENGWFFDSTARNDGSIGLIKAYGRALAAASKAVKGAAPEAVVVSGGVAGSSIDFPRIALEEGAGPYVDVVAFHPYGHPTPEGVPDAMLAVKDGRQSWQPTPPEIRTYEQEIAAYKKVLRRFNPRMLIWADEMNWFAPSEPPMIGDGDQSELTQAKHLARFYALNGWLGCGAIWWSLYNANHIQEWAVIRSWDLTPRAAYYSAGYVSTVLDDTTGVSYIPLKVIGDAPSDLMVKAYRTGSGRTIIGLWRTGFGKDTCQPVPVTLEVGVKGTQSADLVDSLYGYTQRATVCPSDDRVVIQNILVGDWPVFVRL